MSEPLSAAQRELLTLYTQKAYEVYLAGNLKKTQEYIKKIREINPGDANALFLDGAVNGRGARPGKSMDCIRTAFRRWMPLLTQLKGERLELMQAAIDEAFSVMSYTPVEIASRQWDVYQNAQMVEELADVLEYLLALDDEYQQRAQGQEPAAVPQSAHAAETAADMHSACPSETAEDVHSACPSETAEDMHSACPSETAEDVHSACPSEAAEDMHSACPSETAEDVHSACPSETAEDMHSACLTETEVYSWIHSLFVKKYVFWIDCVLGINKPIPVTGNQAILRQYHRVLTATESMAERMTGENKSEQVVGERAKTTLERFHHLNP